MDSNDNPALTQELRYEPAQVIPLKQETSLLDWLESNNRLIPRETTSPVDDSSSEEDEEISELMDADDSDYDGDYDSDDDDDEDLED